MTDDEAIQLLHAMVKIPSVSCEEAQIAHFLASTMESHGLEASVDAAGNAVGVAGSGGPTLCLLGHMDTVPGDLPVSIQDGKLFGRGSVDAKGPLAAFVVAAIRWSRRGDPGRVVVIGCVEEEAPSSKGARFAKDQHAPDLCIVGEPSGWDAMTLGYKGFLRATLVVSQDCGHTAHPTPTAAERGFQEWARVMDAVAQFNAGRTGVFEQILPALVAVATGTDGRTEHATLRLNLRLPPDLPPEPAAAWLTSNTAASVSIQGALPAWLGPRTTPLHRALSRGIRSEGATPRYLVKTGTADLNIVAPAWKCPALAYGPGDAKLDHTPNEHIILDEYLKGIRVLEVAIREALLLCVTEGKA